MKIEKSLTSGRPLIHIETSDYEWERRVITRLLLSTNVKQGRNERNIFSWSPYLGFRDELTNKSLDNKIVGDSVAQKFIETLDNFIALDGNDVLIIEDISYYLDFESVGREFLSQLSSRLYYFYCKEDKKTITTQRATIILVCPKFNIPIELQGLLYRLTPPYPDDEDIAHELGLDVIWEGEKTISELEEDNMIIGNTSPSNSNIHYHYGKSFFVDEGGVYCFDGFEENKKKVLSAFKGMRIKAIQTLLSYNDNPYEIVGEDNMDSLLENKKRMVMDSGLLKLEDVPEGYSRYVGDIEGLKEYMGEVKTIIDNRANYNDNMSMPKGILLVGPPGCGKSETSKAIADILNVPLLSLDMGRLMSKWSGEQEHNFENAIALAEAAQPCVLRIDELEKAFSGTGNTSNNDQSGLRVLGFFLTWMQERSSITGSRSLVYLVATANNLDELRPEFLRKGRWDEIFYLIYPTKEGMAKIIQSCLRKYKLQLINEEEEINGDEEEILIKNMTTEFFKEHPKCKLSGAEIADAIERVYKTKFRRDPSKPVGIIDIQEVKKVLSDFAKKNRNYEVERKVRDDIRNIQIEHQRHYHPLTKEQEDIVREIIEKKYSQDNVNILIQQEVANLRISHLMNDSRTKFNKESVEKAVKDKYTKDYIKKLKEDEFAETTMSFHINNEPAIAVQKIKMIEKTLREKYEDIQDYEEFYISKGYKSASKPWK